MERRDYFPCIPMYLPVYNVKCFCLFLVILPTNAEDKRHAYSSKLKFSGLSFSDHISLSKSFKLWSRAKEEGNEAAFCGKNFISNATMEMISGMRSQLISHLKSIGLIRQRAPGDMKDLNSNSQNWSAIKAAVLTGAYPALLKVDRESGLIVSENEKNIRIHPSSVLFPTDGMFIRLIVSFFSSRDFKPRHLVADYIQRYRDTLREHVFPCSLWCCLVFRNVFSISLNVILIFMSIYKKNLHLVF